MITHLWDSKSFPHRFFIIVSTTCVSWYLMKGGTYPYILIWGVPVLATNFTSKWSIVSDTKLDPKKESINIEFPANLNAFSRSDLFTFDTPSFTRMYSFKSRTSLIMHRLFSSLQKGSMA